MRDLQATAKRVYRRNRERGQLTEPKAGVGQKADYEAVDFTGGDRQLLHLLMG